MKELPLNQILCGDNREILPTLPEDSIDLVVTSPPYWGLRDYGHEDQIGLEPHPQLYVDNLVEICREIKRIIKPSGSFWLNLGDTYYGSGKGAGTPLEDAKEVYIMDRSSVPKQNHRSNWLQPKQLMGIPWRVATALQDDGWILRNCVIWYKPNHMPESVKDRLTKSYEFFFFFVKSSKNTVWRNNLTDEWRFKKPKQEYYFDDDDQKECPVWRGYDYYFDLDSIREPSTTTPWSTEPGKYTKNNPRTSYKGKFLDTDTTILTSPRARLVDRENPSFYHPNGKNPGDMWEIPTQPFPGSHFAVFPPDLIEPIIKSSSPVNGTIMDPFAGSGTTLRVARKLGRKFIGIELNPEYAAMCERRVRADTYTPPPEGVPTLWEALEK